MITVEQYTDNTFWLSPYTRAAVGQSYAMKIVSVVTEEVVIVFPTPVTDTPRSISFLLATTVDDRLAGATLLQPEGSWTYELFLTDTISLTASGVAIEKGLMNVLPSCAEQITTTFVSSNETGEAIFFGDTAGSDYFSDDYVHPTYI